MACRIGDGAGGGWRGCGLLFAGWNWWMARACDRQAGEDLRWW